MVSDNIKNAAKEARSKATPVIALAGHVLTTEHQEQVLAMQFMLLNDTTFHFLWLAARAFQYRDRLEDAIDSKSLERLPDPMPDETHLAAARLGLGCQALDRLEPSPDAIQEANIAQLSGVYILPPREVVISVETAGGRKMDAVLDTLAIQAFIALVKRAERRGLFDERNVL